MDVVYPINHIFKPQECSGIPTGLNWEKVKELLLTTSMNITEVGYEVGLKSVSVFSKVFKEEFGCSPTDFIHQKYTGSEIK